jgi:hypothetical protein
LGNATDPPFAFALFLGEKNLWMGKKKKNKEKTRKKRRKSYPKGIGKPQIRRLRSPFFGGKKPFDGEKKKKKEKKIVPERSGPIFSAAPQARRPITVTGNFDLNIVFFLK